MRKTELKSRPGRRAASTLFDVIAGTVLMTLVFVPTLNWSQQSATQTLNLRVRSKMLAELENRFEQVQIDLSDAQYFDRAHRNRIGVLRPNRQGYRVATPLARLVTKVDVQPNRDHDPVRMLDITVRCWIDTDRDRRWDNDEPSEVLTSQWVDPDDS